MFCLNGKMILYFLATFEINVAAEHSKSQKKRFDGVCIVCPSTDAPGLGPMLKKKQKISKSIFRSINVHSSVFFFLTKNRKGCNLI